MPSRRARLAAVIFEAALVRREQNQNASGRTPSGTKSQRNGRRPAWPKGKRSGCPSAASGKFFSRPRLSSRTAIVGRQGANGSTGSQVKVEVVAPLDHFGPQFRLPAVAILGREQLYRLHVGGSRSVGICDRLAGLHQVGPRHADDVFTGHRIGSATPSRVCSFWLPLSSVLA